MPRLKSYWNGKANAMMTPDQHTATDERYMTWLRERHSNSEAKRNAESVVRARQWAKGHPEEMRAAALRARAARKARRLANPVYMAKHKAQRKKARQNPKHKIHKRASALRTKGWTAERYDSALQAQGNCCALCRDPFLKTPCADHKHCTPPVPRGLLCNGCNSAIGFLKDSPELLENAAAYLRKFSQPIGAEPCVDDSRIGETCHSLYI